MSRVWPDLLLWMGVFLDPNKWRIVEKLSMVIMIRAES
jgi:hypothetical protein